MSYHILTSRGLDNERIFLQICVRGTFFNQALVVQPVVPALVCDCKRALVIWSPACGCTTDSCWDVVVFVCIHARV